MNWLHLLTHRFVAIALILPGPLAVAQVSSLPTQEELVVRLQLSWNERTVRFEPDLVNSWLWSEITKEANQYPPIGECSLGTLLLSTDRNATVQTDLSVEVDGRMSRVLSIHLRPPKPDANIPDPAVREEFVKLWNEPGKFELAHLLQSAVARFFNQQHRRIEQQWTERLTLAEENWQLAEKNREELQHVLNQILQGIHPNFFNQEGLFQHLHHLQTQIQSVHAERATLQARHDAIREQLAQMETMRQIESAHDPVSKELQRIVDLREQSLDLAQTRVSQGLASMEEQSKLEEHLALAKVELARHRQRLPQSDVNDEPRWLQRELIQTTIHAAELEARLKQLDHDIGEAKALLPRLAAIQTMHMNLDLARENCIRAAHEKMSLEQECRKLSNPTVILLEPIPAQTPQDSASTGE